MPPIDRTSSGYGQSCLSCRRLKRRCSKELPTCSLCQRVGRQCQYDEDMPSRPNTDLLALGRERYSRLPSQYESLTPSSNPTLSPTSEQSLPATLLPNSLADEPHKLPPESFLDSTACRNYKSSLPKVLDWSSWDDPRIPFGPEDVSDICQHYFGTTHSWFPILSTIRIKRLLRDVAQITTDATPLFLAMSLVSKRLLESKPAQNTFYASLKSILVECESRGIFSINLIAAQILTALYEMGHGLYPAAYLTVGHCSRLGYALGLHDRRRATQLLPRIDTWTESEERRRLWWATMILDRYSHIGFRYRPLSTSTIQPDEIIPADDSSWDRGEITINPLLVMTLDATTTASPFARTCQASHLAGKVIEHVNEQNPEPDFHFQEAFQIHRAATSLASVLDREFNASDEDSKFKLFTAIAIINSALITLYDSHSCIEADLFEPIGGNKGIRIEMQQVSLDGLKLVTADMRRFFSAIHQTLIARGSDLISPLIVDCLYLCADFFAWTFRETENEASLDALNEMRSLLKELMKRWSVAGIYLGLLGGTEFEYKGGCRT